MTNKTLITGFPRIGENRELKNALESFWAGNCSLEELEKKSQILRKKHWLKQKEIGINLISSNDFSYYDNMLDTAIMLNAIPKRFQNIKDSTEQYFAMARGAQNAKAMEMTKWFNTNYHYIVPELDDNIQFKLNAQKIIKEYKEAKELGIKTKINIIGPITFVALSKSTGEKDKFSYFDKILAIYKELINKLVELDDTIYLQIEEPIFVKTSSLKYLDLINKTYTQLTSISPNIKIIISTYFEHALEATKEFTKTNIWGIALDFVYGKKNLEALDFLNNKILIAGVVGGRNIWINNYEQTLNLLDKIAQKIDKNKIIVSTSCSLLHVPYSKENEPDNNLKKWFSFAIEKVKEVVEISNLMHKDKLDEKNIEILNNNKLIIKEKNNSNFINNTEIQEQIKQISKTERDGNFEERIKLQKENLQLPILPTTTIGSFPQTKEIRKIRLNFKKNLISNEEYEKHIKEYIKECILFQDEIGIDVLVHGEPERNDMVEYFGELLNGFHFTKNGWVQSYGSRCVKPPIIYGDIGRPKPMTVKWISYAQSLTKKPVKGMLTGPVTIINWSFVRNDISRLEIAKQIAVALSNEIDDLQKSGIKIVQVDEAAFKEGYPLRKENIKHYEDWALQSFKLAVSKAKTNTQIHTHMCYSEFNDIIKTIQAMDADVITIETARSGNKLLHIFNKVKYKNEIGPGVYDIHSPRIPSIEEFKTQINERLKVINKSKIWVNPDCGLKTRKWEEVEPALKNMVKAVSEIR